MKRLQLVPVFTLAAVALMASPALAAPTGVGGPNPNALVPEPASIVVFGGLAAMGFFAWLWQARKRRP